MKTSLSNWTGKIVMIAMLIIIVVLTTLLILCRQRSCAYDVASEPESTNVVNINEGERHGLRPYTTGVTAFYDKGLDRHLLSEIYVETQNHAYFFSELFAFNRTGEFNYYALHYYLRVITGVKEGTPDEHFYTSIQHFINTEINRHDLNEIELMNILRLSEVELMVGTQLSNLDRYLAYIEKRFDEVSGLFYNAPGEPFDMKIINTLHALYLLRNIGFIPNNISNRLYDTLSSFMDEIDFTFYPDRDHAALYEMFGDGPSILSILESIIIFNELSPDRTIDIEPAREWFALLAADFLDDANNVREHVWILNAGLTSIINVNKYFMLDLDYSEYINFLKSLDWRELLAFDIKAFSDSLMIINRHVDFFPDTDHAFENFRLHLYVRTPFIFFREQYYGFKLASVLGVEINYDLFLQTLSELLFASDSDWLLFNMYYFLLILHEIARDTSNENFASEFMGGRQWEIVASSHTRTDDILREIYIDHMLGRQMPREAIVRMHLESASEWVDISGLESSLYEYILIRLLLEKDIDVDWMESRIMSFFFADQGGFSANDNYQFVNINSTSRMLRLIEMFNLEFDYASYIPILEYRGLYGGYFVSRSAEAYGIEAYGPGFTLEAWFNGLYVYDYIANLKD